MGAHRNVLVGVVHHGYEHVEEHHQRDDVVGAEHRGTNELCELMVRIHIGHVEVDQTEDWPEERLQGLKQPAAEVFNAWLRLVGWMSIEGITL